MIFVKLENHIQEARGSEDFYVIVHKGNIWIKV